MKSPEPDIERKINTAVVTFEIRMMKLVVEMAKYHPTALAKKHLMEAGVAKNGGQRQHVAMEHDQHRMRRHHQVDQHRAEIDDMFDRMHRNARPGDDIPIAMMHRMDMAVELTYMKKPVPPVEMKRNPDAGAKRNRQEYPRVGAERDSRNHRIGMRPEQKHQIGRPDGHTTGQRPENIVIDLTAKGEASTAPVPELRHVFAIISLPAQRVKEEVEASCKQQDHDEIQRIDDADPARREDRHVTERATKKAPAAECQRHENHRL